MHTLTRSALVFSMVTAAGAFTVPATLSAQVPPAVRRATPPAQAGPGAGAQMGPRGQMRRGGPMRPGGPGGPGGPLGEFLREARALNLSDAQKEQLRGIAQARQSAAQATGQRVFVARQALEAAVTSSALNEAAVRQAAADLAAVEADAAVLRSRVYHEALSVLTGEQQAQLTQMRAQRQARMQQRMQQMRERAGQRRERRAAPPPPPQQ
jgi:Spy/CpxP family protein refolding chaperone